MDANDRIARKRLSVLQLAERLGNVAEACRRSGVDRTSFYQWRRRFAREGIDGLRNRPPVHKSHPHATPADVARRIMALALGSPAHGCDRIAIGLARQGIEVSAVTIQKILHKAGLGTCETRALALEAQYAQGTKRLSTEQIEFIESMNPCFRERDQGSAFPGEVLCQGTFFLGRFEVPGPVYLHAVIDSFSSYAFGVLATTTQIEPTLAALQNRALPFFAEKRITVQAVLTGRLSATSTRTLREYLLGERIEHRVNEAGVTNGFVERFRRIAVAEFLRRPFVRGLSRAGIARLQREFDDWLASYNEDRPHEGYRNYGATPASVIRQACSSRE